MSVRVRTLWIVTLAATALGGAACFDPVEVDNAYDGETYLCDSKAFDEAVEDCRAHRDDKSDPCAGVLSFDGILEGIDVVVDDELDSSLIEDIYLTQQDVEVRDGIEMRGASPYFEFKFALKSVGGAPDLPDAERVFEISPSVAPGSTWYEDDRSVVEVQLSADAARDIQLVDGEVRWLVQTKDENVGSFEGENITGDTVIRGCFHAFTTERVVDRDMI